MKTWQLSFPRGLTHQDATAFVAGLHGLARRPGLLLHRPAIIFETTAKAGRIRHQLSCPEALASSVQATLLAALPGVRLEEPRERPLVDYGIEVAASDTFRPFRHDNADATASGLLASLQPLGETEALSIQWVLAPALAPRPPKLVKPGQQPWWIDPQGLPDSEQVRSARQKQKEPLNLCTVRIGVQTGHAARARSLAMRVFSALRAAEAPGVRLRLRHRSPGHVARLINHRTTPKAIWPLTLNASELANVVGIPLGQPSLPGLATGAARQLPLPPGAPKRGVPVANSNYPGAQGKIRLPLDARRQHSLILGPTGSGKSNLITSMALRDIEQGRGLALLDPKGDLVEDLLARIPKERHRDVIVLDAVDEQRPVGLNPLQSRGSSELVVDQLVGTMHQLFRDSWGVRTADVLRASLSTLVATRAADGSHWTLADLPAVLQQQGLRSRLAAQVQDPVVRGFWQWFEGLSEAQRAEVTAPLLNKLRAILLRPSIRRILGQSDGLDLDQIIRERKILLVPLPKGQLGEEAASLLGSLVVAQLWQSVLGRSRIPKDRRSVFMAYIDEAKDFLNLPMNLGDLLAEARGLGLAMHLATQHLGQFPPDLRSSVLANARTKILFKLAHDDARELARHVEPRLTVDDLKGLPPYEVAITSATPPTGFTVTGTTDLVRAADQNPGQIRTLSRSRYGRAKDDIDQAMTERHGLGEAHKPKLGPRPADGDAA